MERELMIPQICQIAIFLLMERDSHIWFLVPTAPLYISPNWGVQFSTQSHHPICEAYVTRKLPNT